MRARESRHNVRKSYSFAWRCAVRCDAMLCCVWSGVEWHGVSNILYIYQIQIEMENIWGITATHHHQRPSSCFLFLCMCFFPASLTLRHFVIISFENMTYLYVYKHEFGKGRFLSLACYIHICISILNRWHAIFWPYKTYRHKTKLNHTHTLTPTPALWNNEKNWWMCCNQTCNDRNANVEQNTRKLVYGHLFLSFYSFAAFGPWMLHSQDVSHLLES